MIREEAPTDRDAVRHVNLLAFGAGDEARLVDLLREEGAVLLSLVAVEEGTVVGHILFSRIFVEQGGERMPAVSLAPMAVTPGWQRRGIGSALVRRGLDLCRQRGERIVVVLGHPEYYPRFGFSAQAAARLASAYSDAGPAWMALELVPGAMAEVAGRVVYPKAFGSFGGPPQS